MLAGIAALAATAPAAASPDIPNQFRAASADGTHVIFATEEAMVEADGDTALDLYAKTPSGLSLLSGGAANVPVRHEATSSDGTRVWFATTERIRAADTDSSFDIYEGRPGETPRLVSTGGADLDVRDAPIFHRASTDGTRVFFRTTEAIPLTGDMDNGLDIYERTAAGRLTLVTQGGTTDQLASFAGNSANGRTVWFNTEERLAGTSDRDNAYDVYERTPRGNVRLVTDGTDEPTFFSRGTADGNVVFFMTAEQLDQHDRDAGTDIYARRSSGALELISTSGSNQHAFLLDVSADGRKVWFETTEPIVGGDHSGFTDIYERDRVAGTVRLISGGGFGSTALLRGASQDGRRVWFETFQDIPGTGDNDPSADVDVYERLDGTALRLISDGGASGQTGLHARFRGAAPNGGHVWFETTERIAGTGDRDSGLDIFERRVGFPATLVSPGTTGDFARFRRASADGRWVVFETREQISPLDNNQGIDVYATAAPFGATRLISTGDAGGAGSVGIADDGSRTWFSTHSQLDAADTDNSVDVYEHDLATSQVRLVSTP